MVFLQDEEVSYHDRDHRREYRTDQIEESRDIIHREHYSSYSSKHSSCHGDFLSVDFFREDLTRNTCRVSIQERRRYSCEDYYHESCDAESCSEHDLCYITRSGEQGCSESDDVHPCAYAAVSHRRPGRSRCRSLGFTRVVTDQRYPRKRHSYVQLYSRSE